MLSLGPKFPESSDIPVNIFIETRSKSGSVITIELAYELSDFFPVELKDKIVELNVDGRFIELSSESLLKGVLKKEDSTKEFDFEFMNFMVFRITEIQKNQLPSDESLSLSFDALLKSNGKNEKERLKSCIKMVNRVKTRSVKNFFTPFLNVCQSSGSGKTKIATELMFEIPSFYAVLREEVIDKDTSERAQGGYPYMSKLSKLFLDLAFQTKDDSSTVDEHSSESTVGGYLLLLKALLSDYIDNFRGLSQNNEETLESILKVMFHKIMNGTFIGKELKLFSSDSNTNWNNIFIDKKTYKFNTTNDLNSVTLSMDNVVNACKAHLLEIYSFQKNDHGHPFVLIVDEASLLADNSSPTGISRFRLFRRAVSRLGREPNFVVLTLGTNSDILDLNPSLTFDSFRLLSASGEIFPPFVLSRNWDLLLDYKELEQSPIGYNEMLNGRTIIFWLSLGRPLWSSISFSLLCDLIRIKITNNSLESGEAYLAFWMVRVGLLVNPTNVITRHLVKSLMATLLHITPNLRSMRVHYPSEPALAIGIRSILMCENHIDRYYSTLEKFINARAIDTGRFSEIISGDICLLAVAKAKDKKKICTWEYNEKLPKVCKANHFILETSDFHTVESKTKIDQRNNREEQSLKNNKLRESFEESYIVIEGNEFFIGIYGDIINRVKTFIPELMKTGLLNMTHYTQVSNKFPFESLKTESGAKLKATVPPLADPRYVKGDSLCNQITAEVLESMIIRGSGIMLAPNTFGLDHVIPICFKPDEASKPAEIVESAEDSKLPAVNASPPINSRPEYSFIGVQVKRGKSENIRTIMAKGAVSNHYVRCGLHGVNGCDCENCKFRISNDSFKRLLENGFMLVHTLTDSKKNLSNDEATVESKIGPKRVKIDPREEEDFEISCETSLPEAFALLQELQQLKAPNSEGKLSENNDRIKAIDTELKNLIKDLCPAEFIEKIDKFKFEQFKPSHYEKCRFIPDIYLSLKISKELSVHCMIKRRPDGINEKLVAIYSKGLEVFSNVLPDKARMTARRIIFDDHSVFDEIPYNHEQDPPIKYTELVTSVVSRNNCSAIPVANNFIRSKYGLPLIPDNVPNYANVNQENIQRQL